MHSRAVRFLKKGSEMGKLTALRKDMSFSRRHFCGLSCVEKAKRKAKATQSLQTHLHKMLCGFIDRMLPLTPPCGSDMRLTVQKSIHSQRTVHEIEIINLTILSATSFPSFWYLCLTTQCMCEGCFRGRKLRTRQAASAIQFRSTFSDSSSSRNSLKDCILTRNEKRRTKKKVVSQTVRESEKVVPN
jgi:hypothetical protein